MAIGALPLVGGTPPTRQPPRARGCSGGAYPRGHAHLPRVGRRVLAGLPEAVMAGIVTIIETGLEGMRLELNVASDPDLAAPVPEPKGSRRCHSQGGQRPRVDQRRHRPAAKNPRPPRPCAMGILGIPRLLLLKCWGDVSPKQGQVACGLPTKPTKPRWGGLGRGFRRFRHRPGGGHPRARLLAVPTHRPRRSRLAQRTMDIRELMRCGGQSSAA
jgi:hypothetical protein